MPDKIEIGRIAHFFSKAGVAVVELMDTLKIGDNITIEGENQVAEQKVESMQIEHKQVQEAKKGQSIGLKTIQPVKEKDIVFKIIN